METLSEYLPLILMLCIGGVGFLAGMMTAYWLFNEQLRNYITDLESKLGTPVAMREPMSMDDQYAEVWKRG